MQQVFSTEIEQEMEKYPLLNFADIVRALKKHPEWLEELRKLILTTELLELPKKVDELLRRVSKLEEDVGVLKQDVAVLKQDVAVLKQDVEILKRDVALLKRDVELLKQDVAGLKRDMQYVKGELGRLKGREFERTVREKYYAYFGRLLRRSKLVTFETVLPLIDDFEEKGLITEEERESLLNLDLIVRGQIKSTRKEVVIAVEISYSLHETDILRALERANVLARVLSEEVIPVVVAAEAKEDIQQFADSHGVLLIRVND
jgi:uncharacterized protein YoxC